MTRLATVLVALVACRHPEAGPTAAAVAQSATVLRGAQGPSGPQGPASALQSSAFIHVDEAGIDLDAGSCSSEHPLRVVQGEWSCANDSLVEDPRLRDVASGSAAVQVSRSGGTMTVSASLVSTVSSTGPTTWAAAGSHTHVDQDWVGNTKIDGLYVGNPQGSAIVAETLAAGAGNYNRAAIVGISRARNNGTGVIGASSADKYGVGVAGLASGPGAVGVWGTASGSNAAGAVGEVVAVTDVPGVLAENTAGGVALKVSQGRVVFDQTKGAVLPLQVVTQMNSLYANCPTGYVAIGGGCSGAQTIACLVRPNNLCLGNPSVAADPNDKAVAFYCGATTTVTAICLRAP